MSFIEPGLYPDVTNTASTVAPVSPPALRLIVRLFWAGISGTPQKNTTASENETEKIRKFFEKPIPSHSPSFTSSTAPKNS